MTDTRSSTRRVLVVDDDLAFRLLAEEALADTGCAVDCADNGDDAERLVALRRPDLILLDNVMPGKSGLDTCRSLRGCYGSECPDIVMVTACDAGEDIDLAFEAGASDYLLKPVNWALFRNRVANWLGQTSVVTEVAEAGGSKNPEFIVDKRGRLKTVVHDAGPGDIAVGMSLSDLVSPAAATQIASAIRRALKTRENCAESFRGEVGGRGDDWTVRILVEGRDALRLVFLPAAAEEANRSQLYRLAYLDPATGLPNRHLLIQTLRDRVERARFQQRPIAVLCLAAGAGRDRSQSPARIREALVRAAAELENAWSDVPGIASFQIPDSPSLQLASPDGQHLIALFDTELGESNVTELLARAANAREFSGGLHAGVAQYPQDGADAEALLESALLATRLAGLGFGGSDAASDDVNALLRRHDEDIEAELLHAIDADQVLLHFQPRVDVVSGEVTAVEALLRWMHPLLGQIGGGDLLQRLGGVESIRRVADWALFAAIRQAADWDRNGQGVKLSVNIENEQFVSDTFADRVLESLAEHELSPAFLELEVTERSLDANTLAGRQLRQLRDAGTGLIVDDFGAGSVQLAALAGFAPTAFKINRHRPAGEATDDSGIFPITRAIADSCAAVLIAKHVETEFDLRHAKSTGCDEAQGFYICQPLAPADLEQYLQTLALGATTSLNVAALT